jgi:hypothetical protein
VKVGEKDEVCEQVSILRGDWFFDLDNQFGAPGIGRGLDDLSPDRAILLIRENTAIARMLLDQDFMAAFNGCLTPAGVIATRYSLSLISLGTPTNMV